MTVDRDYVEFTEESNAVDYLDKAVAFIKSAERNPTDWKCVILAIYGALYGFMICALKGTDPDNVSVGKAKKKLMSFGQGLLDVRIQATARCAWQDSQSRFSYRTTR